MKPTALRGGRAQTKNAPEKTYPGLKLNLNAGKYEEPKGSVVEKLENDKTGRSTVVRLNKNNMEFGAAVGGVIATSADGYQVKQWARDMLAKTDPTTRLEWKPVIIVELDSREHHVYREDTHQGAYLGFKIDRFFIGEKLKGKEWVKLKWPECAPDSPARLDEDEMRAAAQHFWSHDWDSRFSRSERPFRVPMLEERHGNNRHYLPYNEATWQGLLHMLAVIKNSKTALDDLLGTKKGLAQLVAIGEGRALPQLTSGSKS